jgi:hypothetical protein
MFEPMSGAFTAHYFLHPCCYTNGNSAFSRPSPTYQEISMPQRTIRNCEIACSRERDFYEFMNQAPESDLAHQRDLVVQELNRPEHREIRNPVLDLMRERLGILNQALGLV